MGRTSRALTVFSWALYGLIYAPILVVVGLSFNAARHGLGWKGFTLQWYQGLLDHPQTLAAALNSLVLASVSTGISTVLGSLAGYGLSRFRFPGHGMAAWFLYIPVFIPDMVTAVALLLFYSVVRQWLGFFELGLSTMILAHVTFQIPFVATVVRSRMADLDPSTEEAARDLGANAWQTFWHVTLPMMRPGMLAGALLAFTLSLDDFIVSFFTSGPGSTTLPILIYSSVKRGLSPEIHALSALIVLASVVTAVTVLLLRPRARLSHD